MKLHDLFQLITAIIPIAAIIWQVSELKNQFEKKFDIFVARYEERKDFVDYQLHATREMINHKINRLNDEIKVLKNEDSN